MCSVVWLDLAMKKGSGDAPQFNIAVPFRWGWGWKDASYFEASFFVLFMCMRVVCLEI